MLLGVAGSLVAGFIGGALGLYHRGDSGPGLIASVIGAILLLAGYRDDRSATGGLAPHPEASLVTPRELSQEVLGIARQTSPPGERSPRLRGG